MLDAILRSMTFAGPLRAFLDARTPREPVRFGSAGGAFGGGRNLLRRGRRHWKNVSPESRAAGGLARCSFYVAQRGSRPTPSITPTLWHISFPLPAPHVGGVHILSWQVLMCSRTDPPLALSLPGPRAELHPIPSFTIYIPSSSSSAAVASLA